jgi:hypothetical protein
MNPLQCLCTLVKSGDSRLRRIRQANSRTNQAPARRHQFSVAKRKLLGRIQCEPQVGSGCCTTGILHFDLQHQDRGCLFIALRIVRPQRPGKQCGKTLFGIIQLVFCPASGGKGKIILQHGKC